MLTVTAAQLDAWLAALMFPLPRLLGLFAAAPVFSNRGIPVRIKLAIGLGISLALLPALPPPPADIAPGSYIGLLVMVQQMFIGIAIGFMMRIVFACVDMAGSLIGMQMGLSFALFFDPNSGGQTAVLSDFLGMITTLLFLSVNGHLMMIDALVHSFIWLPVGQMPQAAGWGYITRTGSAIFATGLLLSLPVIGMLLISNIAMGILTRAAPQLNLFAIGFPITLTIGFFGVSLAMTNFAPVVQSLFEHGLESIATMLEALTVIP